MITCPVCGWKFGRGDIRPGTFLCPRCKNRLRLQKGRGLTPAIVVSGLLAFLIPYAAGVQGYRFLVDAAVIYFLVLFGFAFLHGLLFPSLEVDPELDDGTILHLTGPPDSSNN